MVIEITPEEKEILLKNQHEYYNFIPALFEIVKECKNRTIDFLKAKNEEDKKIRTRYCYAGGIDYLISHLKAVRVREGSKLINMYRSIAHFKPKTIPLALTYNLAERKNTEDYKEFDKNYLDLADGIDLVFDVDSPKKDVMDAYEKAKEIKKILDSFKLPYYVKNSGFRGFHFIVPSVYMPKILINDLLKTVFNVLKNFKAIHDLEEYIDLSVCNPKGLIKCSYSLSEGKIVSLPLNEWEFNNFDPKRTEVYYVLKNIMLKNRGLFIRDYGLSKEELEKNVLNFIKEYK